MILRNALKTISPYIPGVLKEGAIKLASNENPLGTSPKAIERLKTVITDVSIYPDGDCAHLKQKLADKYSFAKENIIIGNGSDEILQFIAAAYIDEGLNAVTSESTFSEYTFVTKLFGGVVKYAEMSEGKFQLDKIIKLIDDKTRIVFLCNPNNPTGTYFDARTLQAYLDMIPESVLIVLDEAYREYVQAQDYPDTLPILKNRKNIIVLRTFSKIYGLAGLRVGYGIAPAEIIAQLNITREPFNVNYIAQQAALAALDDTAFVNKSIQMNENGKQYLYKALTDLKLKFYPTEANFIFIYLPIDCVKAFEELMELGVTIRPLKSFGHLNAIRVTIGTEEQNRFFIDCLKKIL